ncbi:hypothetical protein CAPTEDRAFT_224679 [Capitella teleta]|uniref:VWFA domain-containing protein n=1 Tax=Capitella teleta TaxID=283909 RepID=R7U428_CAPTE|nr:hypothetical protein CAPTEDRAFT_224679 [Capitella teleta]|eukprot:ELT98426.1 hypothetical protein CAPTEDRAFT_224679 [Capitella teleta]
MERRTNSMRSIAGSLRGSIRDIRSKSLRRASSLSAALHKLGLGGKEPKAKEKMEDQKRPSRNGGTEKFQNSQNHVEEHPLEVNYYCAKIRDQASVVIQLRPQDAPKRFAFNNFSSPTASSSFGNYVSNSSSSPRVDVVIPRVPLRIVCVVDVSHSMAEPYGAARMASGTCTGDDEEAGVSKLEQVKLFMQLLIRSMSQEEFLAIVTFGTNSTVVVPLKKMTQEAKDEAYRAVNEIEVGGVTNMSSGILTAIDLFSTDSVKRFGIRRLSAVSPYLSSHYSSDSKNRRYFDDNIVLFTDGMANEGLIESSSMIEAIRRKINLLKDDCHYEKDYHVKISAMGTAGFLPEMLFDVGQTFSSDPYYFLEDGASLELNLMRPILLRKSSLVTNVKVNITTLNGVLLNNYSSSREFEAHDDDLVADSTTKRYHVHDIACDMQKHFCCVLRLPHKHKKQLKGKEIMRIEVQFTDAKMTKHSVEKTVFYDEIPKKEANNVEQDVLMTARQCCRLQAQTAITVAAKYMKKLNRAAARSHLEDTMNEMRAYCEYVANFLTGEENYHDLMENYVEVLIANLEFCSKFLVDYMVRWDDAWGRLMALASSLGREVPTATGVYKEDAELFSAPKMQDKLTDLCARLRDIYASHGLCTDMLDQHIKMVKELEAKLAEQQSYDEIDM